MEQRSMYSSVVRHAPLQEVVQPTWESTWGDGIVVWIYSTASRT